MVVSLLRQSLGFRKAAVPMNGQSAQTIVSTQQAGQTALDLKLITRDQLKQALATLENPNSEELMEYFERLGVLSPFQSRKLLKGEKTGYTLGRFQIVYKISAGTFARVYRGIDNSTGESVAIKVLRSRHTIDVESIKTFHREARLFESLTHPNIARMLEVGTDPATQQHYISMEFVEGGNLRELLKIRGKFAANEFIEFAIQMVDGLRYALTRGVTHRDIKPTNILISSGGQIKWVDFGLAGVAQQSSGAGATIFNTEQRSVDYAGLEKATSAPKGDPRSDIFFLGTVFYHMLTGEPPMSETKDRNARMLRNRFDQLRALSRDPSVRSDISAIVDKMMAFLPQHRYQDYDSLLKDLEGLRGGGQSATANGSATQNKTRRVIVVHKNPQAQEMLKQRLVESGFQVVLTFDLERAASLFNLKPADCLVVDLDTSGVDAIKICRRLLATENGQKHGAVFLATAEQGKWTEGLSADRYATLLKPLTLSSVCRTVDALTSPETA